MTLVQVPFFQIQPVGEQQFTTTGISTFTVPADTFFISAVCVGAGGGGGNGGAAQETPGGGGGALAWVSNLPVTPGEKLTINVGAGGAGGATGVAGSSYISRGSTILMSAGGGTNGGTTANAASKAGGTFSFGTGVLGVAGISTGGGNGGAGGGATNTSGGNGGGGGAGGYTAAGGDGGDGATASSDGSSSTGGGGGGGEASAAAADTAGGGGGGVDLVILGENGTGGTGNVSAGGTGGSNGNSGTAGGTAAGSSAGGLYGGGGGGSRGNGIAGQGADGAVRIIYGPVRYYPSNTNNPYLSIVTDGLVLNLDAGNSSSYPGTGTAWYDISGNNYNGTLVNDPTYSSANGGRIGFDGIDDYVELSNYSIFPNSDCTFEFWAMRTSDISNSSTSPTLMSGTAIGNFQIRMVPEFVSLVSSMQAELGNFGTSSATSINTIYHIVVQRTITPSDVFYCYVNGNRATDLVNIGYNFSNSSPTLGINYVSSPENFQGNIYKFAHYNRVLSETEIRQNFNALRGRFGV